MTDILFCHDNVDMVRVKTELWESEGIQVTGCTSAAESLIRIKEGLGGIRAAIIHKDLGENREKIGSREVIEALHRDYENVRVGLISGEYPDGIGHVKKLGADFYFPTALITDISNLPAWLKRQIEAGYLSQQELKLRGKKVEMPIWSFPPERGRSIF